MPLFTLAALRDLAYNTVEQDTQFYLLPEVDAIINEAIRITNAHVGFYQNSIQVPGSSVKNQLLYNTPTGILFPLRVQFEGRQLEPYSLSAISQRFYSWMADTTAARGPVAHWVPIGVNLFALHPMDSRGGGDILVTGIAETPLLVNADDVISIEDEHVPMIIDYCYHRLPMKEGGRIFADASQSYQGYLGSVNLYKYFNSFKAPRYYVAPAQPQAVA